MSTDNPALDMALLDGFKDLSLEDQRELARFVDLLNRRAAHPDEPVTHSYAELYGDVVYEATPPPELPGEEGEPR